MSKDQEGKDRRRQLLCYVSLIRACNKVLYQLVYIGKKFVFLKEPLYLINSRSQKCEKNVCLLCDFKILLTVFN